MNLPTKIVVWLALMGALGTEPSHSESLNARDFPLKANVFAAVGKEYVVIKDNPWLLRLNGYVRNVFPVASFMKVPDAEACLGSASKPTCNRLELRKPTSFRIVEVVVPSMSEDRSPGHRCPTILAFCFYKVQLEGEGTAYVSIYEFEQVLGFSTAEAARHPALHQISPKTPDAMWKFFRDNYYREFRAKGIKEGFTMEDVLLSSWGRPAHKTHTTSAAGTTDVWLYNRGSSVVFVDGVVAQVTTSE
jgi:hypothetical protein